MYCSECGKLAKGKFCCYCGARLEAEAAPVGLGAGGLGLVVDGVDESVELVPVVEAAAPSGLGAGGWGLNTELDKEVRYEAILRFPGVREVIERHSRQATKRMSGEQFLSLADSIVPMGVPLEKLAAVCQPFYARLGIVTGKEKLQQVAAPVGRVMVRALCSLAKHGQRLRGVTQAADGCLLEAVLPSDVFALEGELVVSVEREGAVAKVRGATRIPGQIFDWGKSNRCLERLFEDLAREAA